MKNKKQALTIFLLLTASIMMLGSCRKEKMKPEQADTFIKYYGKGGTQKAGNVALTADGGYILVGTTDSYGNGKDILVVKTDAFGNEQWSKVLGGAGDDEGNYIIVDKSGDYVVAGSKMELDGIKKDAYVAKLSLNGSVIWEKTYGKAGKDDILSRVEITFEGGYVAVGTTEDIDINKPGGTSPSDISDVYLIKITSSGDLQWRGALGLKVIDNGTSVQQISDSLFITSASSLGNTSNLPPDGYDIYIAYGRVTLNNTGYSYVSNINKQGSINENSISEAIQLLYYQNDAMYVVGNTINNKIYLLKLTTGGLRIFYKELDISSSSVTSFSRNADGSFIISGSVINGDNSDVLVILADANGSIKWSKTFGGTGNDYGVSAIQTSNGNYIVSCTISFGGNATGANDVMSLIHIDSSGELK